MNSKNTFIFLGCIRKRLPRQQSLMWASLTNVRVVRVSQYDSLKYKAVNHNSTEMLCKVSLAKPDTH